MKKEKKSDVGRSDFHRNPPRPSARRQTSRNRGTDHRHSLYNPLESRSPPLQAERE
ncbi:hypothetical protein B0T09DRAFT_278395 [Sordaria sp. MPI-SDFR-AT-0083]|nr:hypothetical protein B0T09DRAFT_278395 [Sordaria sp. MPI-SDFR-AT-0083]